MPEANEADLKFAFGLPPERAISYFKAKGYDISFDWHEMLAEAHTKAFTVAKATSLDVLSTIREEVQKSLDQGITLRDFQKNLTPRLQALGWWGKKEVVNPATGEVRKAQLGSPYRLRTIYQTNLQVAYAAGRYREQMANMAEEPWGMYVAVLDAKTRPAHRALHGRVFRLNDPIWTYFYPPIDYCCRCRVRTFSGDVLKERGISPQTSKGRLSMVDVPVTRDGRTAPAAVFTDETGRRIRTGAGWAYNPGKGLGGLGLKLAQSLDAAPPEASGVALRQAVKSDGFKRFLDSPEGVYPVMMLAPKVQESLGTRANVGVLSAESAAKNLVNHPELGMDDYQVLPDLGESPQHIVKVGTQKVVLIRKGKQWYVGVLKKDATDSNVFVTSFRKTNQKDVDSLLKRGQVIDPKGN
jgi:SPP1 gp7 family putative phage head morphogenesis protein